jgi:hypothetical protein
MGLTIVTEQSGDRKLSSKKNVSATWAAQASCPPCPLRKNGCYAELFRPGLHTNRLNKVAETQLDDPNLQETIAKEEADGIAKLTGKRKLRVHIVGDCATDATATIVGSAMRAHEMKHGKAAWTYTHGWKTVSKSSWMGARVLASCETVKDVAEARALGWGTALITPPHPSNKIYKYEGERVIPCPAQFSYKGERVVTCEDCSLCQRPEWLKEHAVSIGFQPDGGTSKRVLKVINANCG